MDYPHVVSLGQSSVQHPSIGSEVASLGPNIDDIARSIIEGWDVSVIDKTTMQMTIEARTRNIRIVHIDIAGHISPEDGREQITIIQTVELSAQQALHYRTQLMSAVSKWAATLPQVEADIFRRRIAIRVRWTSNAGTA